MRITRYLWNLLLTLPALLAAEPVNAQSFGLANILNPEGTRLFPQLLIFPRHPGKPDPRWKAFDWKSTEQKVGNARYKLFFYEGENWGARFAIPRINEQIESLTESFGFTPPVTFNYLLFTSLREFRQANIFFISEGVQGITSTTESTMAIPFWGHVSNFDHISKHEMVHQFQVQKIRKLAGPDGEVVLGTIPLWFIEGMAEYYSQGGVDVETRQYIRDLLTSPKKDSELPKFFDPGPLSFVGVYKVGQVKNAFIEEEFGHGTIQRILETYSMVPTGPVPNFKVAVEALIGQNEEEIEKRWKNYIERHFRPEIEELAQPLDQFDPVYDAGENLDLYKVSPDGTLIATREVDPLSGIASIQLIDLKDNGRKIHIARDQEPSLLSLYFLQLPGLAISNNRIAYAYDTTSGPGIEIKNLSRDHSGKLEIGNPRRLELFRSGMIQVSSPAFSPDGHRITFVALKLHGWDNVYVIDPDDSSAKPRALTTDHYGWSDLSWGNAGIFGASERTSNGKDNIFRIDPETAAVTLVTHSAAIQTAPDADTDILVFQSWESGSSQIHLLKNGRETRLTAAKTGLFKPQIRGDRLYALGFRSGRYHLYRIPQSAILDLPTSSGESHVIPETEPWKPKLATLPEDQVKRYNPFSLSSQRLDDLVGFFGSGSVGGISATTSDLMRNYSITAEFSVLGSFRYTNTFLFLTSQRGRATWTTGGYYVTQPRLDSIFARTNGIRTYLHREYGALGAIQYPLTAFSYFDLALRVAGVNRGDFSDSSLAPEFAAINPGSELMLAPMARIGYDRVTYELYSGPLKGYGLLLEADTSYFPSRKSLTERIRLDVAQYIQLFNARTTLALQALGGVSFGGTFMNPFFISSDDIFRAYIFGDDRLYGNYIAAAKTELRFPIGSLFGFQPLRGLIGYDLGTIFVKSDDAFRNVASSATLGFGLNVPPIAINFMSSYPIRTAPGPVDRPIFHFTLRYLYL